MNKFRKPHGGGGDRGFGGGGGSRPSFGGGGRPSRPPFSGSREDSGKKFDAICAKCGKPCQVPFQPNGKKPVYCRDCFGMQRQDSPRQGQDSFVRRDAPARPFESRNESREPAHPPHVENHEIVDLKREIDVIASKVDVILRILQDKQRAATPTVVPVVPSVETFPLKNPKGTFRKDAATKKSAKKKGPVKK